MSSANPSVRGVRVLHRIAAVALLFGLVAVFWWSIISPLWSQTEARDARIDSKREQLARYLAVAKQGPDIDRALQRISSSINGNEMFAAQSEAIAAANLQNRLTSLAASNRVSFRSARLLQSREEDNATLIGVRIHLAGGLREMQKVIHAIESAVPYMFIDAAQVTGSSARTTGGADPQLILDAQLDVFGLFQKSDPQ